MPDESKQQDKGKQNPQTENPDSTTNNPDNNQDNKQV